MAISFPDAVSSYVVSSQEDPATNDLSHEVTAGTTLLLCFVAQRAAEVCSAITWNSVSLTRIDDLNTSTAAGDVAGSIWGLISPTPATADFNVTSGTGTWLAWHIKAGLNVHGTNTDSVAAAISNLSMDDNNVDRGTTNVHASGGSAGNWLLFFGAGIGDDMVPASNNATFNELAELQSGGTNSSDLDGSIYIADKAGISAITVTFAASDENIGGLFEIVAGAASVTLPGFHGANRGIMRGFARGVG